LEADGVFEHNLHLGQEYSIPSVVATNILHPLAFILPNPPEPPCLLLLALFLASLALPFAKIASCFLVGL
jgi:hypothetical protein